LLRGRGRSGGPEISYEIGYGEIDLVAHSRDHGKAAGENRSGQSFIVKTPKVFLRTPSPGDDDQIYIVAGVKIAQPGDYLGGSIRTLHQSGKHFHRHGETAFEDVSDILQGSASGGSDNAYSLWIAWQSLFVTGIKEAFLIEFLLQLFKAQAQIPLSGK